MFVLVVDFVSLLLAALVVGALFGARLFLNPAGLDANVYVAVQQQGIRTMNTVMPVLGAATILVTIVAAVMERRDRVRLCLLVMTAACFLTIGLITRFLNQPINAKVMTWRSDSAPSNWAELRDEWWRWHLMRVATGLVGLSLLIVMALRRG